MIETRKAIQLRSRTIRQAKDLCEECGKSSLLIVRTNQRFNYGNYIKTGRIEQRELSAVCAGCFERMARQTKDGRNNAMAYCRITPTGQVIEYR